MRISQWEIITIIGIALIIVHGLWKDLFEVDYFTVIILFILAIPFLSQFLKRAKVPGAEFEFRDEIESTKKAVQKSVKQSIEKAKSRTVGKSKPLPFETFNLQIVKTLLNSDPVLALASLRIEIERKLRLTAKSFKLPSKRKGLFEIIQILMDKNVLSVDQVTALRKIINMCNIAIHGYEVSTDEATEIVHLADDLNKSFPTGYSINFYRNEDYDKQGLACEWEHCIEHMPLKMRTTEQSCPIFGHNCPGGADKVSECEKIKEKIIKALEY